MFNSEYLASKNRPSLPNPFSRLPEFRSGPFPYFGSCLLNPLPSSVALNGGGGGSSSLVLDNARGDHLNGGQMSHKDVMEAKALAALKSHSEAERRRRERINAHLCTLRSLIPSTNKMDKASLLAEVIGNVKELKKKVAEIAKGGPVPTDFDELRVESAGGGDEKGKVFIKASLCCDDRPDLLADLSQTLQKLRLKTVKAEISTLGGRVKNVFLMTNHGDINERDEERLSINNVQAALKAVLDRAASNEFSAGSSVSNKRQRILPFETSSSAS